MCVVLWNQINWNGKLKDVRADFALEIPCRPDLGKAELCQFQTNPTSNQILKHKVTLGRSLPPTVFSH